MVLATTLTDHVKYDWQDLAAIYAQRWDIELRLRDVKTTLRMDHLRVKTRETARKTLRMALIAYNLIKSSCQEAAHFAGKDLRLMSFKGAVDTIASNTARYLRRQKHVRKIREIWASTIEMIAEKVINYRAFRWDDFRQQVEGGFYKFENYKVQDVDSLPVNYTWQGSSSKTPVLAPGDHLISRRCEFFRGFNSIPHIAEEDCTLRVEAGGSYEANGYIEGSKAIMWIEEAECHRIVTEKKRAQL